jgi:hypothetical protein
LLPALRSAAALLLVVLAPHLALLGAFWATGALDSFVYDAYLFNQAYYSRYVMSPTALGILHDLEAQYRTYLLTSLRDPFGLQCFLVVSNLAAAWLTARRRGWLAGLAYYVFVVLTRVRAEGAYYMSSYASVSLVLLWAVHALRARLRAPTSGPRTALAARWLGPVCAAGYLLLSVPFLVRVVLLYVEPYRDPRTVPNVREVQAITAPDEPIVVVPYDPYVYLAAGRLPATRYEFYFPWQADDPRTRADYLAELQAARPPVVVFRAHEEVNAGLFPIDYARHLYDYLQQAYVPVDAADPRLADIFVLPERVQAARLALEQAGLLRTTP